MTTTSWSDSGSSCSTSAGNTHLFSSPETPVILIDEGTLALFQWIVFVSLTPIISSFGAVANIVNITCFVRLGLKDPVNVSLLGLAISDFGGLVSSILTETFFSASFFRLDLPFDALDMNYIVSAWPYFIFTGVSSWLTALITLERCLCIMRPLQVKTIITPKRVKAIIVCFFILMVISVAPIYYVARLTWIFSPKSNRTILQVVYTPDRQVIEPTVMAINSIFIPISAYLTIIVTTAILVIKLRSKAAWRETCTTRTSADNASVRDQKVSKMVIAVSTVYIICCSPIYVTAIVMVAVPGLSFDGPNQNVLYAFGGISMLLQNTNASANILIYYHMSSKFKIVCRSLTCAKYKTQITT